MPKTDALKRLGMWMSGGPRWVRLDHSNGIYRLKVFDADSDLTGPDAQAESVSLPSAIHAALDQAEGKR